MTNIKLKRAYDSPEPTDGFRIYIDRLWPRGLSHSTFHYDEWVKDLAPTTELREWFHADPVDRWGQFQEKYAEELKANPAFSELKTQVGAKPVVTLLFSSKDTERNNAIVLRRLLLGV